MKPVHAAGVPRPLCPLRACAVWIAILVIFVPSLSPVMLAQSARVVPQASARPAGSLGAEDEASEVELMVGRSTETNRMDASEAGASQVHSGIVRSTHANPGRRHQPGGGARAD